MGDHRMVKRVAGVVCVASVLMIALGSRWSWAEEQKSSLTFKTPVILPTTTTASSSTTSSTTTAPTAAAALTDPFDLPPEEVRLFSFGQPVQVTNVSTGHVDQVALNAFGDMLTYISNENGSPDVFVATIVEIVEENLNTPDPTDFIVRLEVETVTRITSGPGSEAHPRLSAEGDLLIFQSTDSLDPNSVNGDNSPETYLKSLFPDRPPAGFKQLTNDQGNADVSDPNPAARLSHASTNDGGDLVVFASTVSPDPDDPSLDNLDRNQEIYLYDRFSNTYHKLTDTGSGVQNLHPVINTFGTEIAFVSNNGTPSHYNAYVMSVTEEQPPCVDDPTTPEDECCVDNPDTIPDECCIDNPDTTINECTCVDDPGTPLDECNPIDNTPPQFIEPTDTAPTVDEGAALTIPVRATDADLDFFLTLDATDLPQGATFRCALDEDGDGVCDSDSDCIDTDADEVCEFTQVRGTLSIPTANKGGSSVSATFMASDGIADVPLTLTITINDVNHPPTLSVTPASQTVKAGKAIAPVRISGSDADGDTLSLGVGGIPSGATRDPDASRPGSVSTQITWTPTLADVGDHTITATVDDGHGGSKSAQGTITVVTNRPPTLSPTTAHVNEGECLTIIVKGSDPDGDPVTIDAVPEELPADAVFLKGTSAFHWHPHFDLVEDGGAPVTIGVTFRASDGVETVSKTIQITISNTPLDQAVIGTAPPSTLVVAPGAEALLTVTLKNTGYTTWTGAEGYALAANAVSLGLPTPAPAALAPTESVPPGSSKTFTMKVKAPTKLGLYYLNTKMSKAGVKFGTATSYTSVKVQ